ncbi:hypothetical protein NCTGTJJY_CDS0158 [Serratia phage 92A1]|nr:hypothetical protein NCTGTJJY_CDS0158 [Serratia phage 92A1]
MITVSIILYVIVVLLVWSSPTWIAKLITPKPLWDIMMDSDKSIVGLIIAVALGPVSALILWLCYKDAWVKVNLAVCQEALEPWDVSVRKCEHDDNEVCIRWHRTFPPGRRECAYVNAYKALRDLEKMPIADWTLKYLPRLDNVYKSKADQTIKLFKG